MVHAFSRLLLGAFCVEKKKNPTRMEEWFKIEYGKEWRHALNHYKETGNIHWK